MGLNDGLHDGQAKSHPAIRLLGITLHKGRKNPVAECGGETGTLISYLDPDLLHLTDGMDPDRSPGRGMPGDVLEQVDEDLFEEAPIDRDPEQGLGQHHAHRMVPETLLEVG